MPSALSWPLASHFSTMLQNPQHAFRDAELKRVAIEKDDRRQPRAWSGAFATVYKGNYANGRGSLAIRVFTSAASERRERYNAIAAYLQGRRIEPLVGFTYADDGIRSASDGKYYPLVTMEWVPGETLLKWTGRQCREKNQAALQRAGEQWVQTVEQLVAAKVSHGDLQHANVMVTTSGQLKLVDYDCMCVPALVGRKNLEIGVEPYQHPERNHDTPLSLHLDNYSALFILAALRALAAAPDLWQRFIEPTQYDKLLFRREDLDDPARSELMKVLKRSGDPEVPRLCEELVALRGVRLDQVPQLDSVLFSYAKVESLLNARDFEAAIAMVNRSRKPASAAPTALQPRIRNAHERVERLAELERAIAAGDERAISRLYEPKLLDDFPHAQAAVALAKTAPRVAAAIDQLAGCRRAGDWRQFVRQWDAHEKLLHGRKSAERFEAEVKSWRQRNQVCDAVLALLAQPDCDAAALDASWKQLVALGGHPDTNSHRAQIERILQREFAWSSFTSVPAALNETTDTALVEAWNEVLFFGWKKAEAQRPRVAAATRRLQLVAELERLAALPTSISNEDDIYRTAADLPSGYGLRLQPRLKLAHDRLHAVAHLKRTLHEPISDLAVAGAWERLEQIDAQPLVSAPTRARATLASQRANLLCILKQIPPNYPIDQASQLDRRLLSTWNDALLAECHDADAWRASYQAALRRQGALEQMKAAIAAGDKMRVAELASEDCLDGYPLPSDWARIAKGAVAELRTLRHLMGTLKKNDRAGFHKAFDARVLRRHPNEFAHYRGRIEEWIAAEMLASREIGLAPPVARKALAREPGNNGTFRLSWQWPEPRYSEQCIVTLCRSLPARGEDPRQLAALIRLPVDRRSFEEGGGSRILHVEADWFGSYVVVWAMIDAGFHVFASEPLVLGRLDVVPASAPRRGSGFFGAWVL
ncbi:MAG TPA: hypothetical protein VG826_22625 [Pirellulales bacterium]|nr:hypothetical protein [Pirellulales bacterium]